MFSFIQLIISLYFDYIIYIEITSNPPV